MIKAVGNRLVVLPIEEKQDVSRLIITLKGEDQLQAIVMAKGNEVDDNVSVDDIVIIRCHGGVPFKLDGVDYLSIIQSEIMAVTRLDE